MTSCVFHSTLWTSEGKEPWVDIKKNVSFTSQSNLTHWSELILSSVWALGLYISSSSSSLSTLLESGRGDGVTGDVLEGWGDPTQLIMSTSTKPFWAGEWENAGPKGSIPSSTLLWAGAVRLFLIVHIFWKSSSPSSSSSAPPSRSSSKEMMLVIFFFLRRSFFSPESGEEKVEKTLNETQKISELFIPHAHTA